MFVFLSLCMIVGRGNCKNASTDKVHFGKSVSNSVSGIPIEETQLCCSSDAFNMDKPVS